MKLTRVLDVVVQGVALGILTVLLLTQAGLHRDVKTHMIQTEELQRQHQIMAQAMVAIYQNQGQNKCVNNLNYSEQDLSKILTTKPEENYRWQY